MTRFTKETGIEVVIVAGADQDAGDGEIGRCQARCRQRRVRRSSYPQPYRGIGAIRLCQLELRRFQRRAGRVRDPDDGRALPLCDRAGLQQGSLPDGKQPKSWAGFWDAAKFPGARMLADMASGSPNLEFALIADWYDGQDLPDRYRPGFQIAVEDQAIRREILGYRRAVGAKCWPTGMSCSAPPGRGHILPQPPHHRLPDEAVHEFTPSRDADSCRGQSRVQRRYFCARRRGTGKGCK